MPVKTLTLSIFGGALFLYMAACTIWATSELWQGYQDARRVVAAYEAAQDARTAAEIRAQAAKDLQREFGN